MAPWQLDQKDQAKPWYDKSLAWQTANEAEADPELQGFYAEAEKLMAADADESQATSEAAPAADNATEASERQ